jgi:branched-chain amino acid transport system ATP-binding protein
LKMIDLISNLAKTHAILLVEHDMDAVFQLARVLTVMANGKVLASGKPDDVRANGDVRRAYLGDFDEHP